MRTRNPARIKYASTPCSTEMPVFITTYRCTCASTRERREPTGCTVCSASRYNTMRVMSRTLPTLSTITVMVRCTKSTTEKCLCEG